jgi:hypothetical protein
MDRTNVDMERMNALSAEYHRLVEQWDRAKGVDKEALEGRIDAIGDDMSRAMGFSETEIAEMNRQNRVEAGDVEAALTDEEREQIQQLRDQRAKKYDEICAHVAGTLGYETNPAVLSEELVEQIAEEADELIENWEEVEMGEDDAALEKAAHPEPGIQQLLAEHWVLCGRIEDVYDEAFAREHGDEDDDLD